MGLFIVRKGNLHLVALCSIAVMVFNFLAMGIIENDDIENVDMSVLAGHSIIVDPGHGGIDNGASGNHVIEKQLTLEISTKLAQRLREHGVTVSFTRESDVDYYTRGRGGKRNDLLKRIEIIENSGAELFISIHCNAFRSVKLAGAQVFYSPKISVNKILGEKLQQALRAFSPGNKHQAKADVKILVLNGTKMPGVLIETGYVTNQQEAALLANQEYQEKLVTYITKGLAYYFSDNVAK